MQVKCKYCDSFISDTDERCKNCGAKNDLLVRTASGAPKTIEELKNWYVAHNLPDENITRFFIGKDFKEAKAFGIYKDEQTKNFIVYKNKDNGSRMVRYEGKDEAYAVNELYQKLKEEIQNQKNNQRKKIYQLNNYKISDYFGAHIIILFLFAIPALRINPLAFVFLIFSINPASFIMVPIIIKMKDKQKAKKVDKYWHIISIVIFAIMMLVPIMTNSYNHRNDAYYQSNNTIYYHYGNYWYYYDNDTWNSYDGDTSNFEYLDDNYSDSYNVSDFSDSEYCDDGIYSSSSSDWDSDSSWDSSDSWDSGGSDWSSDW